MKNINPVILTEDENLLYALPLLIPKAFIKPIIIIIYMAIIIF